MANTTYHPIPSPRPQSKRPKRTAQSALDWNKPRRQSRTPRREFAFMREFSLLPASDSSDQRGGGR